MFIFSADNLSQMYRRLRYVREYADYQLLWQGASCKRKQEQVQRKRNNSLQSSWKAKEELLQAGGG